MEVIEQSRSYIPTTRLSTDIPGISPVLPFYKPKIAQIKPGNFYLVSPAINVRVFLVLQNVMLNLDVGWFGSVSLHTV